ncbi:hypothetical protein ACW95P_03505 [Candidatus Mycoplasma pogonae]
MILKISLYALIGILLLILFIALVWRIVTSKKPEKNNKLGVVSPKTISKFEVLAKTNNWNILVNLLVNNKYAKQKFSQIPGVIVTEQKLYFLSDHIINGKAIETVIPARNFIKIQTSKNLKQTTWNCRWYLEIAKWAQNFDKASEMILLVENANNIINESNLRALTIAQLETEISALKDSEQIIYPQNVIKKLKKLNVWQRPK